MNYSEGYSLEEWVASRLQRSDGTQIALVHAYDKYVKDTSRPVVTKNMFHKCVRQFYPFISGRKTMRIGKTTYGSISGLAFVEKDELSSTASDIHSAQPNATDTIEIPTTHLRDDVPVTFRIKTNPLSIRCDDTIIDFHSHGISETTPLSVIIKIITHTKLCKGVRTERRYHNTVWTMAPNSRENVYALCSSICKRVLPVTSTGSKRYLCNPCKHAFKFKPLGTLVPDSTSTSSTVAIETDTYSSGSKQNPSSSKTALNCFMDSNAVVIDTVTYSYDARYMYHLSMSINTDRLRELLGSLKDSDGRDFLEKSQAGNQSLVELSTLTEICKNVNTEKNVFWCLSRYRYGAGPGMPIERIRSAYKEGNDVDKYTDIVQTMRQCFPSAVLKHTQSISDDGEVTQVTILGGIEDILPAETVSLFDLKHHLTTRHIVSETTSRGIQVKLKRDTHEIVLTFPDLKLTFDETMINLQKFEFPSALKCNVSDMDMILDFVGNVNICNGSNIYDLNLLRLPCKNSNYTITSFPDVDGFMMHRVKHTECDMLTVNAVCPPCNLAIGHCREVAAKTQAQEAKTDVATIDGTKKVKISRHKCGLCPRSFDKFDTLFIHMDKHKDLQSRSEVENDSNVSNGTGDANKHTSGTGNNKFKCEGCNKDFSGMEYLLNHRILGRCVSRQCVVCEVVFDTTEQCKTHLRVHKVVKVHTCPICDKTFSRKDNLKAHIERHAGIKKYTCDICHKRFLIRANLKIHIQKMHVHVNCQNNVPVDVKHTVHVDSKNTVDIDRKNTDHVDRKNNVLIDRKKKAEMCEICGKCFAAASHLVSHQRQTCHKKTGVSKKCEICGKCFATASHLASHQRKKCHKKTGVSKIKGLMLGKTKRVVRRKNGKEQCSKCCQMVTNGYMKRHNRSNCTKGLPKYGKEQCIKCCQMVTKGFMKMHHLSNCTLIARATDFKRAESSFTNRKCSVCDEQFTDAKSLSIHLLNEHMDNNCKVCGDCGERIPQGSLESHMKSHSTIKTFKCELCNYEGTTKWAFAVHIKTHLQTSIKCTLCGKRFNGKENLIRHKQMFHGEAREHECHICNKVFKFLHKLRRHMNTHAPSIHQLVTQSNTDIVQF